MLNFKGWEKIAEDKKTTTLKHEKGHTMTLAHTKLPKIQQEHLKRLRFAGGTPGGTAGDTAKDTQTPPATTVNVNTSPSQAMPMPAQSPQPVPVNVPATPPAPNVLLPNGSMNAPASAQAGQTGAKTAAQVQAAQSEAAVPQLQQYLNQTNQLNEAFAKNTNELKAHADDLSAHQGMNENAYLENRGAGRRILSGIGLLLGGAGAGLAGGSNPAEDFLNKQIDRNIQAQRDRFGQANTVWGAYKDLYGSEQIADNMARVHALDMLTAQAKQTAAKLGTPTAFAGLNDLLSKTGPERNKLILDSAGNLASVPNNPSGPAIQTANNQAPEAAPSNAPQGTGGNKSIMGPPSAEANTPKLLEPDEYADSPILNANAQEHLDALRYTPKAKEELDQIKSQYTKAQQADTLLNQLHSVHQQLFKDAQAGGRLGYLRRHDPTASIPFAGHMISQIGVQPITDTQVNRDYDTNKTRITGDITNALRGTNVGPQDVRDIVDANTPEHGDTPEMVAKKERNIRVFIKNAVDKSLLKDWGLAKNK